MDEEIYRKVKDYSKDKHRLITYYEIGKLLNEVDGKYGDNVIEEYSKKLMIEVGKKYTRSTLFNMKQLYVIFSEEKVAPLVRQLSWSQCLILIPLKDINKIYYYTKQVIQRRLSKRQLEEIAKNKEYDRLSIETKNKLIKQEQLEIKDLVPNPILIKNTIGVDFINEKILHQLVLEDITCFMKELRTGFSFIDSEYKIKIGDRFNYIDILLFNIKFNAYVVVELKVTEFKVEYISQV